jgi:hypothetical protein
LRVPTPMHAHSLFLALSLRSLLPFGSQSCGHKTNAPVDPFHWP